MVWQDLLLDRWVDERALTQALAAIFEADPTAVLVVDDITAPALDVRGIVVLAERTRRRGQFPLQLGVYIRDDTLWQRVQGLDKTVHLVRRLCGLLRTACLITGDQGDSEADFLIRPGGDILRVALDEDRLDDDEFVVVASEPFEPASTRTSA
jgi:hypothetical protein